MGCDSASLPSPHFTLGLL
uniref:Uncharacterized protein n=1 Tax=Arundo donax TaxID=35708 RepID=A0A0A8Z388_ARUDO